MIYFEDLEVGAETDFGSYEVTREEVIEASAVAPLTWTVVVWPEDS